MNKITKLRMQLAEDRLRDSAPEVLPRALALNVRDGHCRDMAGRKEAVNAQG